MKKHLALIALTAWALTSTPARAAGGEAAGRASLEDWNHFLPALAWIIVFVLLVDAAFVIVIIRKRRAEKAALEEGKSA